jgi:hypothetical protein
VARMRYLKPEFWTDSKVIRMSPFARLLFQGSWNFALCDAGHLDDDALALKLKVLPADPVNADELLEEVIATGRIVRKCTSDGKQYLQVLNLTRHQKVDTRWTPRCLYCSAESSQNLPETRESFGEGQRDSAEPSDSHQDSGKDGMGGERRGDTKPSSSETADAVPDADPSEADSQSTREDVDHLCRLLIELMVANGSRKRNVTQKWRDEGRRLLDRDRIPLDEAENVLRWALQDSFWKANIESIPTFREKFDRLRIQRDEARRKLQEQAGGNVRAMPPQAPKAGSGAWNRPVVLPGPDATGAA